jgi:hypothetical protein
VFGRINLSPVTVEKLVWRVRQRSRAYLTLFVLRLSSRIPLIALLSVVLREGFDRLRGRFSVRSFRGSRRRCIRLPDIASFGYSLGSSPHLQGSRLRSTTEQLIHFDFAKISASVPYR